MIEIFAILFMCFVALMFLTAGQSYNRAKRNKPHFVKHGMVIDNSGKLIGTETDVMLDPVSGIQWIGKTRFLNCKHNAELRRAADEL
jgi:uncharacterized membrane protein